MARVVGGISPTPTIRYALDNKCPDDPVWVPVFESYKPIRVWLEEIRPDAMVAIYGDHATAFAFDSANRAATAVVTRMPISRPKNPCSPRSMLGAS
jgi:gallate dioxygenase